MISFQILINVILHLLFNSINNNNYYAFSANLIQKQDYPFTIC